MDYVVCAVSNVLLYEKYFIKNANLAGEGVVCVPQLMKKDKITAGEVFNNFLARLPNDARWIVFTRDCLEFLSNPFAVLRQMPEKSLYGVWGARLAVNGDGEMLRECLGKIEVDPGSPDRPYRLYNLPSVQGACFPVETLDSFCIAVPARALRQGLLRFTPALRVLYGEVFCLDAMDDCGLPSAVLPFDCYVHGAPFPDQEVVDQDLMRCADKFVRKPPRAAVHAILGGGAPRGECIFLQTNANSAEIKSYDRKVAVDDYNLPSVIITPQLKKKTRILDCGCAGGDNGLYFSRMLQAELHGMDYSAQSVRQAREKSVYTALHRVDLNAFSPGSYSQYYRYFDYIVLLDVLEHLLSPFEVLQKLRVFLKPRGFFVLSLPNLGSIYPIASLLNQDFTYNKYGILDETHIRFFTWKTLATGLAENRFSISHGNVSFALPDAGEASTPKSLPESIYAYMLEDRHFFVCQYVCLAQPSAEPFGVLKANNLSQLDRAVGNNPEGWKKISGERRAFRQRLALTHGCAPNENLRGELIRLCDEGRYLEAVLASGLFDEAWYRRKYNEIDFSCHPLEDYLTRGWKEGRNPSEAFDAAWYLRHYPLAARSGICPLLFHLSVGLRARLPHNGKGEEVSDADLAGLARHVLRQDAAYAATFAPEDVVPYQPEAEDTRLVAFYLPQFSPFPENDRWWGKGFTEWTNVTKATPQFAGHYQPRLPYDVGFYDLRIKNIAVRQEELARHYGIYGFCYHYYWFGGTKIMQDPISNKLLERSLTLPFCISWANESWSANWDGSKNNLLIDQPAEIDAKKLFDDLFPYFKDDRYITVEGKPFFMIYRPAFFARDALAGCIDALRSFAVKHGLPGLHIVLGDTFRANEAKPTLQDYGADAFVEFPPHQFTMRETHAVRPCNPRFRGRLFDLPELVGMYKKQPQPLDFTYRTVFPMWDNTARKAETGAQIYTGATPEVYADWLGHDIAMTKCNNSPERNMVFINAWNEWAEGAYLEPDRKYGYAFLRATKETLHKSRAGTEENNFVFISVYIDKKLYLKLVVNNKYIEHIKNIDVYGVDNRVENICIAKRYNQFLDGYDYSRPAWLIFCHSDWEIRAPIAAFTRYLDKNAIYGPIGAILHANDDATFVREYRGQCMEKNRDGSGERLQLCQSTKTGDAVDTVDCQCLMVHSSLVARHSLRFDEHLHFDLYAEDFCIAAKKYHGIETRIINIPCCHWNQTDTMDGRLGYYNDLRYLNEKYSDDLVAGVVSLIGRRGILVRHSNLTPRIIVRNA